MPGLGEGDYFKLVAGLPLLALACLGLIGLWREGRRDSGTMLAVAAFAPFAAVVVVSLAVQPILISRILSHLAVPFAVLVAAGMMRLQDPAWRGALLGMVCAVFLMAVANTFFTGNRGPEPWDEATAHVENLRLPGDAIWLYVNHNELAFDYYYDNPERTRPLPRPYPAPGMPNDYPWGMLGVPALSPADLGALDQDLEELRRLWLVTRGDTVLQGATRALIELIERHMQLVHVRKLGEITLRLYEVPGATSLHARLPGQGPVRYSEPAGQASRVWRIMASSPMW
jgi:hypothetical protein